MGHVEVVELLLSHPLIDVNMEDSKGDSPLAAASHLGHAEIAALLVQAGAR
jgi:ankyrin repeat protein